MEFSQIFHFPPPTAEEMEKFGPVFQDRVSSVLEDFRSLLNKKIREGTGRLGLEPAKEPEFLQVVEEVWVTFRSLKAAEEAAKAAGFRLS